MSPQVGIFPLLSALARPGGASNPPSPRSTFSFLDLLRHHRSGALAVPFDFGAHRPGVDVREPHPQRGEFPSYSCPSCFNFLIAASRGQRLTPSLCVSDLSIYEPTQVSFYLLHWKKGTPVYYDQGKYDHLTFWEQIDGGSQFTSNKKFFTIIPIAM